MFKLSRLLLSSSLVQSLRTDNRLPTNPTVWSKNSRSNSLSQRGSLVWNHIWTTLGEVRSLPLTPEDSPQPPTTRESTTNLNLPPLNRVVRTDIGLCYLRRDGSQNHPEVQLRRVKTFTYIKTLTPITKLSMFIYGNLHCLWWNR